MQTDNSISLLLLDIWSHIEDVIRDFDKDPVMRATLEASFREAGALGNAQIANRKFGDLIGEPNRELCISYVSYLRTLKHSFDQPGRRFIVLPHEAFKADPLRESAMAWRRSDRLRATVESFIMSMGQVILDFHMAMVAGWIGNGWCDLYLASKGIEIEYEELFKQCSEIYDRCYRNATETFSKWLEFMRKEIGSYLDITPEVKNTICISDQRILEIAIKMGRIKQARPQTPLIIQVGV